MDPLSAFGLAAGSLQFLQFATGLIKTAVQTKQSKDGTTDKVLVIGTVYQDLSELSTALKSGLANQDAGMTTGGIQETASAVQRLSRVCLADCDKLLSVVKTLQAKPGAGNHWLSFRLALKTVWKEKDIQELEDRVLKTQATLSTHLSSMLM